MTNRASGHLNTWFGSVGTAAVAGSEKMDQSPYVVFAALIATKVFLLVDFGPVLTPDSAVYSDMAQTMLLSHTWLVTDLGSFSFRMIGYPAFIASAMAVSGSAWPYLVVCIQSAISLCVAAAALRLGEELHLSRGFSLLAVVAYATSLQLTLDQCILTDSLNASFVILATVLLVRGARAGKPLLVGNALSAGVLLGLAFLLREFMQILIVLFLLFLVARVAISPKGMRIRTLVTAVLVFLPPLATMEAYREWNAYRTGVRFVTTGARTTALQALANAAQSNPDLLSADTPVDRAMRRQLKFYTYDEVLAVNTALFAEGHSEIELARMATSRYLLAWQERPFAMLSLVRTTIRENQVKLVVRAFIATCEIIEWGNSQPRCPDYRDVYRKLFKAPSALSAAEIAVFILVTIQNALSIAVFAGFLIGVPIFVILAWRSKEWFVCRTPVFLLAAFWGVYVGWDFAYLLVHFENRYMAPVIPLSAFGGLFVMQEVGRLKWQHV